MLDLNDRYSQTFESLGITAQEVANVTHHGGKRLIIELKDGRKLKVYDLD